MNNNNNNQLYFLYYHQNGKVIILWQQVEYELHEMQNIILKNSTLVIIDSMLFQQGQLIYLQYNYFIKVIFLPFLLKKYIQLMNTLQKSNILFILQKKQNTIVVQANKEQYLFYYNVKKEELETLNELVLPIEILLKHHSYPYTYFISFIGILRIWQQSAILLNIMLIIVNVLLIYYKDKILALRNYLS